MNEPASGSGEDSIGHVLSVRGSEAKIGLPAPWPENDARATVGKFLSIRAGQQSLIGMITEVTATTSGDTQHDYRAIARVALMGQITADAAGAPYFHRGVSDYP